MNSTEIETKYPMIGRMQELAREIVYKYGKLFNAGSSIKKERIIAYQYSDENILICVSAKFIDILLVPILHVRPCYKTVLLNDFSKDGITFCDHDDWAPTLRYMNMLLDSSVVETDDFFYRMNEA